MLLRRLPRRSWVSVRLSEGSRLVDAFVEEHPGGEEGNALTKGPERLGFSVLAYG